MERQQSTAITAAPESARRARSPGAAKPANRAKRTQSASGKGSVEVVETYFDAAGRPIKRKGVGAARISRAYDAQGHQVEESYFNAEGKPTVRKDLGASRIAWRYDADGRQVETTLFGPDGAPVNAGPGTRGPIQRRALEPA
jgi:YD repeat-containing protein